MTWDVTIWQPAFNQSIYFHLSISEAAGLNTQLRRITANAILQQRSPEIRLRLRVQTLCTGKNPHARRHQKEVSQRQLITENFKLEDVLILSLIPIVVRLELVIHGLLKFAGL